MCNIIAYNKVPFVIICEYISFHFNMCLLCYILKSTVSIPLAIRVTATQWGALFFCIKIDSLDSLWSRIVNTMSE